MTALIAAATICIAGAAQDSDLAPLYCPEQTETRWEGKDGSKLTAEDLPTGFGKTRLHIAERYLARRDEDLALAATVVDELEKLFADVENTKEEDRDATRKRLEQMRDVALVKAETALLEAVDLERKRLLLMRKALEAAFKAKRRLPGVDGKLVRKLLEIHESNEPEQAVRTYIAGLKLVTSGIIEYLDEDMVGAVAKMDQAARACPDLPIAFLYLGSFSIIMDQPDSAIEAWKHLLRLEPNNNEVRQALKALGVKKVSDPKKKSNKQRKRR